jgi:hypothetical protein
MCTLVALAMALDGSGIPRPELNDMVDVAIRLGITSSESGGISAAGCVRLAREYGEPGRPLVGTFFDRSEFGALGEDVSSEDAKQFFRKLLSEKQKPVVVMSTVKLSPTGCGHAQCIVGTSGVCLFIFQGWTKTIMLQLMILSVLSRNVPTQMARTLWANQYGVILQVRFWPLGKNLTSNSLQYCKAKF